MTLPMLETLRLENARVQLSLVIYNEASIDDEALIEREGYYYPPAEEFIYLRTTITNTLCECLHVFCVQTLTFCQPHHRSSSWT